MAGFLFLVLILAQVFAANHRLTEQLYFKTVYPPIAAGLGFVSDLVPFSIQEIIIGALIICLLWRGIGLVKTAVQKRIPWKVCLIKAGKGLFWTAAPLLVLFHLVWGFNYYRVRLVERPHYDRTRVSPENLRTQLQRTLTLVNKLRPGFSPLSAGKLNHELNIVVDRVCLHLNGIQVHSSRKIKRFLSGYLALTGFNGVCLPFLMEAHVAIDALPCELPFISAHEKTHLKGHALESEANYIAWLACSRSQQPSIRYSGQFALLRYLLHCLPRQEHKQWLKQLHPLVLKDMKDIAEKYRRKSRFLRYITRTVYNSYLKSNRIESGMANYGQMVNLVLGYRWHEKEKQ